MGRTSRPSYPHGKPAKRNQNRTKQSAKLLQVSVKDVGETCADKLLHGSGGKPSPYYYKHFGPRLYSTKDIQKAVEGASEKKVEVRLVEKKDLGEFFGQYLPEVYVPEFVEMTLSGLPGGITTKDFDYDENTARGKVDFEDIVKEWLQG